MEQSENRYAFLDKVSFWIVAAMGFLLPVFFIPVPGFSLDGAKGILLTLAVLISFSLWLLGRLVDGKFSLPKSFILGSLSLIALVLLVASILSPAPMVSIFGQGFEMGSLAYFVAGLLLVFLSATFFTDRKKIFYLYGGIFSAAILIAIFQLVRLFAGADTLSLGYFTNNLANTIGKWNDLAIFFGFTGLLSLLTIELLPLSRVLSYLLYVIMAVSLFFLALINFQLAWIVVGATALVIFVYGIYVNRSESVSQTVTVKEVKLPIASLVVLILAFLFVLSSSSLGAYLSSKFGISQVEVRPSLMATYEVAKETLKTYPVLGAGPNRFVNEWLTHKPVGINDSLFWNADFNWGFGLVPTSLVTAGLPGLLAWILFLGVFLYSGFKAMFNFSLSSASRYLAVSSFVLGGYLWAFAVLYVPAAALFALGFLMTGVLIAVQKKEGLTGEYQINLLGEPKLGFLSVLIIIFLVISSATLAYVFSEKTVAMVYFQKSLQAINVDGNIDNAEASLTKAVGISEEDIYYRALSELYLIRLNNLFGQSSVPQETLRTQFQALLGSAIDSARRATEIGKYNYGNFMALGRVYEAIVPLNIDGAYESAKASYEEGLNLNPESPAILLTFARLEATKSNIKEARAYITKALEKKANFTEALFFLAQLEAQQGNVGEAIRRTEEASLLAPNDVGVFFQLGLLKYNNRDYAGAAGALERAIALSPNYSNAKYFLGLSYERLNRDPEAIKQFEDIEALNPDNAEVKSILKNLRAGKAPFANTPPPNNQPERRAQPPIEE